MDKEMETRRSVINDNTKVTLYNESGGPLYYKTENVKRNFVKDSFREVTLKELKDVILTHGQRGLFDKGYLIIRDERVRDLFSLEPLSKYNPNAEEMKKMLQESSLDDIEDFLQYTSDDNLEKIVRVAIDMPLTDLNRANLIAAYSGYNIISLIEDKEEQKQATGQPRTKVGATAPADAATPARRRRVTPKE